MLILTRRPQEEIIITGCQPDDRVIFRLISINGNQIRAGWDAPPHVIIHRKEIQDKVDAEDRGKIEGNL